MSHRSSGVAVGDYGAGNLVSIGQALEPVGAAVRPSSATPAALDGADAARRARASAPRRRRWPASTRAGSPSAIRAWIGRGRPFLGICLGLQLLFEGSDEDGADDARRAAGPHGRPARRADASPTSAGTRSSVDATHPLFDGIAGRRRPLLRPLVRRWPPPIRRRSWPTPTTAARSPSVVARDSVARRPVPSRAERPRRAAAPRELRRALAASGPPAVRSAGIARRPEPLMLRRRVIPCLDVADGRVVKGTRFVDLVDEGDPAELAARYAAEGADELVFLDITAAPERRGTLLDVVERTARSVFIPLTVGGGVRSVDDMRAVLRAGADKVGRSTRRRSPTRTLVASLRRAIRAPGGRRGDRRPAAPAPTATGLGGPRPGRARRDRPRRGRLGRARGRARRGRAARDLDRPRRDPDRVRHRAPRGRSRTGSRSR